MKHPGTPFSIRRFVSLLLAFCFAGLAISGIVMYFAPPCSIAAATGWNVIALSKTQWASLHQVSALVIVFLAVIHLFVYNWRTFICYFRQRRARRQKLESSSVSASWFNRIRVSKELVVSVLVAIVLYIGALTLTAPFGWLHEGSEAIENYYRMHAPERSGRGTGLGGIQHYQHSDHESMELEPDNPEINGGGLRDGSRSGRGQGQGGSGRNQSGASRSNEVQN